MMMNRREVLKSVGLIVGGSIVGGEAFLTGCTNKKSEGFLNADQMSMMLSILLDHFSVRITYLTSKSPYNVP